MSCPISLEKKMTRSINSIRKLLSHQSHRGIKNSFSGGHWGRYIPILSILLAIITTIDPMTHFECFKGRIYNLIENADAYLLLYILLSNKPLLLQLLRAIRTKQHISIENLNDRIDKFREKKINGSIDIDELANVAISYQTSTRKSSSDTRKTSSRSTSASRKQSTQRLQWQNESHGVWRKSQIRS